MTDLAVPNHHAHYPGFAGVTGLVAALSFLKGRDNTASLACDLVNLGHGDHLVDIGSGPGTGAAVACHRGARVTAVDPANVMLRVGRIAHRNRLITWRIGSAEHLPVGDGEADVVWSLAAVHHWTSIEQGLAEAQRVLTPNGRFLAIERRIEPDATGHASHGWTDTQADMFATMCTNAGLHDAKVSRHDTDRGFTLAVLAHM